MQSLSLPEVRNDITKEEAARRQLETAITLFFFDSDAISIHVLASSAAEILHDLCKAKKVESFRDRFKDYIRPEYLKEFLIKMKSAYNYSKHADRDPFEELEYFNPDLNSVILFSAIYDYGQLYEKIPATLHLYRCWYFATHPKMMKDDFPYKDELLKFSDNLYLKDRVEQIRYGKDLLRTYLITLKERLPITGW